MSGSWFYSVVAMYWKERWASILSLVRGKTSKFELVDLSVLVGWYDCSMLCVCVCVCVCVYTTYSINCGSFMSVIHHHHNHKHAPAYWIAIETMYLITNCPCICLCTFLVYYTIKEDIPALLTLTIFIFSNKTLIVIYWQRKYSFW